MISREGIGAEPSSEHSFQNSASGPCRAFSREHPSHEPPGAADDRNPTKPAPKGEWLKDRAEGEEIASFRTPVSCDRLWLSARGRVAVENHFRAVLIAACFGAAAPASYAQVRVLTGDTEHIYGDGGKVLDSDDLRARNERVEKAQQIEKIRRQAQRRQGKLDAKAGHDQAISNLNEAKGK